MLIVTTIYCMEAESVKKLEVVKPADEPSMLLPEDGREFLGIYQGKNRILRIDSES